MLIIHALPTTYVHATTKSAVVTALIAIGNPCVKIYVCGVRVFFSRLASLMSRRTSVLLSVGR